MLTNFAIALLAASVVLLGLELRRMDRGLRELRRKTSADKNEILNRLENVLELAGPKELDELKREAEKQDMLYTLGLSNILSYTGGAGEEKGRG